jgi:hypothetical protein
MKTIRALLAVVLLLAPIGMSAAQDQGDDDPTLYAISVPVQRVYPHSLGYKVIYNRSDLYPDTVYLPGRWFTEAAGKAEIVRTRHPSAPYLTVFYRNGDVSHMRLFVHADWSHRTWGALPSGEDLREQFSSDEFRIRY